MSGAGRLRVTIESVPLVVQPADDEAVAYAPARRGEALSELKVSAEDRTEGRRRFEVVIDGWRFEAVVEPAARADLREKAARASAGHHPATRVTLRAQIPGRVVRVWVSEGETVEQNQRLLAIEAMKMENEIRAPLAGVVGLVRVVAGALVERHDELLIIS